VLAHGRAHDGLVGNSIPLRDGAGRRLLARQCTGEVAECTALPLQVLQARAGEVGLKVLIASPDQDLRAYQFGPPLRGLLLTSPDAATEPVAELARTAAALTLNPQEHGSYLGDAVFPDYYAGMDQAVAHLLACGHRRLGYLGERPVSADSRSRERLLDFREACDAHGVAPDEADIHLYAHDAGDEGDRAAVASVLAAWRQRKRRPSAFVLYNDNLAVKVYQAAREFGVRIPEDVSLVGYDNEPVCEHLLPKLTSVSPEFFDLGRMAVQLLMAGARPTEAGAGRKMICPVKLMVRASVALKNG
jgi:DNA-binding LacI/PurR family transcriptional regulator